METLIRKVVVVGGGSAGFMAALSLKKKIPRLEVVVIRSKEIGIIGVGEGSAIPFTYFIHHFLGLEIAEFVRAVKASWKLGTYFIWGPRKRFVFPFGRTLSGKLDGLSKAVGYYCSDDMENASLSAALMAGDKIFERGANGGPILHMDFAYHIENASFAEFLESLAVRLGVKVLTDTVRHVHQDEQGVRGLDLESGQAETADLYIDCSGFGSLLLGQTLKEPFVSYQDTLICDRAIVGGWARTDEPVRPYTTAETMNSGWCWQIEHPDRINRGYVYSSAFISDDDAQRELIEKNPKITGPTRVVRFASGRYERSWVKNVVAIGNSSGFVEPLEATSLSIIATRGMLLAELLLESDLLVTPAAARFFNSLTARAWDSVRKFLATHYRFNTRLDTPFWRHCRAHTNLAGAEPIVEWYQQMGPSPYASAGLVDSQDIFGIDGFLVMLLGQSVPHESKFQPSEQELHKWNAAREQYKARAANAMSVGEVLAMVTRGHAQSAPQRDQFVVPMAALGSPGLSFLGKVPGGV
ncbi:MAG TPA: tryptophan halogenase family protein [Tepidisphaeraceae bacterium]